MEFSIRRVNALFKKEVKSFGKNKNVLLMCFMPMFFTFMNSTLTQLPGQQVSKIESLILVMGMNFVLVSSFVMAFLISEEKEKNTMRTLMLSSVSPLEFLAGKAMMIFIISVINKIIMYQILGLSAQYLGIYIFLSILVIISMIVIGATIGLIAQNQMSTGVVGMPIVMLFMIVPVLGMANETFLKFAKWLPNYNLQLMLERILNGQPFDLLSKNLFIIIGWILLSTATFVYTYNKKGLDS